MDYGNTTIENSSENKGDKCKGYTLISCHVENSPGNDLRSVRSNSVTRARLSELVTVIRRGGA
jgi:hypothetical protein